MQNKTVVTDAFKGEDLNQYLPILKQYGMPVLYNFREEDMKWVVHRPKAKMHVLDTIFPEGIRIPDYFFGKNIVHLPTVKCHIYTTTTGAMKNAFGGLLHTHRHYTHTWIHKTLVDLLAIQKEIHTGIFAIMDGTTAGNGPGPRTMFPVVKNWMLASADQVAIDAVAAKMMGFDPLSSRVHPGRARGRPGRGRSPRHRGGRGRRLEGVVGLPRRRQRREPRRRPALVLARFSGSRSSSSARPLVNVFIFGSEAYHDYYRWPLKDRRVFEKWLADTPWGQLFQRYAKGPIGPAGARQGGAPEPVGTR